MEITDCRRSTVRPKQKQKYAGENINRIERTTSSYAPDKVAKYASDASECEPND